MTVHIHAIITTAAREDAELAEAIDRLAKFVMEQALATELLVGFGYTPMRSAPNTYDGLRAAFARSEMTGAPLPVSSEHCESVIFLDPAINYAMRFWHDVSHVRTGMTFRPLDELELALHHLDTLEAAGQERGGLVWQLLHADLAAQNYLVAVSGHFPADQRRFVKDCLRLGIDRAILQAARQRSC